MIGGAKSWTSLHSSHSTKLANFDYHLNSLQTLVMWNVLKDEITPPPTPPPLSKVHEGAYVLEHSILHVLLHSVI